VAWKSLSRESDRQNDAFEELALPLFPSLYNVAHWLTHSQPDAEDLVQETFFKALRGFSGFEQGTNFKAWIFRILRNTYLTSKTGLAAMRTVYLDEQGGLEATVDWDTPESRMVALSDQAEVRSAMETLPPALLEVLLLCDVEEMKYKDIATVLEIPIGTVMSRVARARGALRRVLMQAREERL
jgi:RNA polymerase sigma-70 factor (ECF subfamily)